MNLENIRHSLAHILAAAIKKLYGNSAHLNTGPAIENGFYYDIQFEKPISEKDFPKIEQEMRAIIKMNLLFSGEEISESQAKELFKHEPFKLRKIEKFVKEDKKLTIYKTGDIFVDLCEGGHAKNTSEIDPNAFKLTHLGGSYFEGDEKAEQLTRIYGAAFATKKELDEYLKMLEEGKKRDHKKLGPELDLFLFSPLVGSGLPLWTPKGTLIRDILDSYVWQLRKERGYERVDIPHLAKKELYETSGHWDKFKDELFKIKTREGHIFAMKPMNCPHHIQIYARRQWSYRDLPQRYASTTKVYRDEQTGELAGLSRTRAFTQDDAHVFCRPNQMKKEFLKIWDIVDAFYKAIGFENLNIRLSFHDPKEKEKYLGNKELWEKAESALREIVKARKVKWLEAVGEAAFYGPKVDFIAKDSMGREWQVATIQLDMNLPERFDLFCIDEAGKKERVIIIHAAIMGSIERLLSILIEHYAGAFPLWLSPVQARVIAVSEKFQSYANGVLADLRRVGIRADIADANETLGKRIRAAQMEKIPYVLVVGENEKKNNTVAVRHYKLGDLEEIKTSDLIARLQKEILEKTS